MTTSSIFYSHNISLSSFLPDYPIAIPSKIPFIIFVILPTSWVYSFDINFFMISCRKGFAYEFLATIYEYFFVA